MTTRTQLASNGLIVLLLTELIVLAIIGGRAK